MKIKFVKGYTVALAYQFAFESAKTGGNWIDLLK